MLRVKPSSISSTLPGLASIHVEKPSSCAMSAVPVVCWLFKKTGLCDERELLDPPCTLLNTVCWPVGRMSYPDAPTLKTFQRLYLTPPCKWVLKPNVVKGRSKSRESVIVLAMPTSAKGVRLENERSKWFVQSKVPRPVLRPFLLSPTGA